MTVRVLLADDEALARRRLLRFLRGEPDVEVVAECEDGAAALAALAAQPVDVVLLDIQMPGMDGFDVVAAHGPERMPATIFVTAYDAHAVRAFQVHALDYLLKPVTAERFHEAFRRAREHLERVESAQSGRRLRAALEQVLAGGAVHPAAGGAGSAPGAAPRYADRVMIKANGRVSFVRTAEVDWFQAEGNYVAVHVGKATHLIRETISGVEASLNPAHFARIHRSTIVNLDRIREMQPWFAGDHVVILRDGTQLKLSRTFRQEVQARLHAIR